MSLPGQDNALGSARTLVGAKKPKVSKQLLQTARQEPDIVVKELESRLGGLTALEAEARIQRDGFNEIAREKRQSPLRRL